MSEVPTPEAVVLVASVPGMDFPKGHILTDQEIIRHIWGNGFQRSVVVVHRDYANAHVPKPAVETGA